VSLAGGLTDLDIQAESVVPEGTELAFEVQVGGKWYRLDDGLDHLSAAPDIVPLRAVLLGTSDLAPAFVLAADALSVSRAGLNLVHWSTQRVLPAASDDIEVRLVVADSEDANDTLTADLIDGANTYNPAITETEAAPDGATRFRFVFNPEPGVGIGQYQIRLTGTRTAGSTPFVVTERTDVAL